MNNFTDMLSKAKEMQEKMKQAQDAIKKIEVEGSAGGELVKVVLTGDYEIKSITISEEAKKEKQDIINDMEKYYTGIIYKIAKCKVYIDDLVLLNDDERQGEIRFCEFEVVDIFE